MQDAMDLAISDKRYESRADIVLEAFYLWLDREMLREAKLTKMRGLIDEGRKGKRIPAEKVFAELRARAAGHQGKLTAAE